MKRYCNDKIVLAYWDTTYRLVDQEIDVFIAQKNDAFMDFLISQNFQSWAIITAFNPRSEVFSRESNVLFNRQLKIDLEQQTLFYCNVLGIPIEGSDWEAEESFFVADITLIDACDLAKKYNQNAIVYGNTSCLPSLIWLEAF